MSLARHYVLSMTTQGPTYPPSEVMNADGDFVVIGRLNRDHDSEDLRSTGAPIDLQRAHGVQSPWGGAIVAADSAAPRFGLNVPYRIIREFDWRELSDEDRNMVLCTLPIPLPCNNYEMTFAPEQERFADMRPRRSYAFHETPIPDLRSEDGRRQIKPITLGEWVGAKGTLDVTLTKDERAADFGMIFSGLIPDSLYTMMSLRERDFDPAGPTRPGPLGIPNVLITDVKGNGRYHARLPNPFPAMSSLNRNRIVNVVLLWMSYQTSYCGALGLFGLGGDVHAQLKLREPSFFEFVTRE